MTESALIFWLSFEELKEREPVNARTVARECLLFVGVAGGRCPTDSGLSLLLAPRRGPLHLTGLLLKDLFVDLRLCVWLLGLAPYILVQLVRSRLVVNDFWS